MSKHQIVKIKTTKDWYNIIAKDYKKFYKHLDSFDNSSWIKYLPRNFDNKIIVDLWAGDWRIYKKIKKYVDNCSNCEFWAVDISEEMLSLHPKTSKIIKKIVDLNNDWNLGKEIADLVLWFFVLEHIEDLHKFSYELNNLLKFGWVAIFWYFLQRRSVVFKNNWEEFKIFRNYWNIEEIVSSFEYEFLKVNLFEVVDKTWVLIWYHIVVHKK